MRTASGGSGPVKQPAGPGSRLHCVSDWLNLSHRQHRILIEVGNLPRTGSLVTVTELRAGEGCRPAHSGFDVEGPVLAEVFVLWRDGDQIALTGPCCAAGWFLEVGSDEDPMAVVSAAGRRVDLARGGATEAPTAIATAAVIEHALRHLAWLIRDDPAVAERLADGWAQALGDHVPEPFRHLS